MDKEKVDENIRKMKIQKDINNLPRIDKGDIDPDQVLAKAYGELDQVVLTGFDKEGKPYYASSVGDGGDILWLIKKLEFKLMENSRNADETTGTDSEGE